MTKADETQEIPVQPSKPPEVIIKRTYRDAVTYTTGITLIMSQLVLQVLDSLDLLHGEPSPLLLSFGAALIGAPFFLHMGDRKEDGK
jgi:hypothetical protein